MGKKFNQKLLNEELKKFRLLSEYSFYTEEPKKDDDDLILGSNLGEVDEEPDAAATDDSKTAANQAADDSETSDVGAPADDQTTDATANIAADTGAEEAPTGDMGVDVSEPGLEDTPTGDMGADSGEEVEVDVTQLVKGAEEAKKSAELNTLKTSELLDKFGELEKRVAAMDSISSKIDTLEKEIVKRNPTPVEKLEMRSLSSFPYNIKLTDYWKDVDGYDATGQSQEPEEYLLTKDDIDSGYTDSSIKDTFNVPDDYEEEDIM
jgi:hypothetical protein